MFQLLGSIDRTIETYVACSGGVDSMAVLDFLINGGHNPIAAYFNHGTAHSEKAEGFVRDYCSKRAVPLIIGRMEFIKQADQSLEEYWRIGRYNFFHGLAGQVITCHHLDDCIETWIFTALNGTPKLIPYKNGNVIRPFLMVKKAEFSNWCVRKGIIWMEDESNKDVRFARNRIRHMIVPEALKINPGLHKVIAKKLRSENTL